MSQLYTDCINYAPLSSSFINMPVPFVRSANATPGFGGLGPNAQSYFGAASAAPGRPRSALTIGTPGAPNSTLTGDDEPPRSRKEWIRRWMLANPSKPAPVSAKAIYRLADSKKNFLEIRRKIAKLIKLGGCFQNLILPISSSAHSSTSLNHLP